MSKLFHLLITSIGVLSLILVLSTSALAVTLPAQAQPPRGFSSNPGSPAAVRRAEASTRSAEAKLKACQAKENAIKQRSNKLTEMANNMLSKFDKIASRVEEYYASKVLPSGKTVAGYDSLVADIQTKKNEAEAALASAQNDVAGFSCETSDPKSQLLKFREDMIKVKLALHHYRTSVKNLIVAVHSVTSTEYRASQSANPRPSRPPREENRP